MAKNIVAKQVIDIEALLHTKIDEKSWKANKELLKAEIEGLKPIFDTENAEVNAKKLAEVFNQAFEKASMPKIGFEDIINDADAMANKFAEALGKINNVDVSVLNNILNSVENIKETTDKIFNHVEKNLKGANKQTKGFAKSIAEIDSAATRLGHNSTAVSEAFEFASGIDDIEALKKELDKLRKIIDLDKNNFDSKKWEEQYLYIIKFINAYQKYEGMLAQGQKPSKSLSELYDTWSPRRGDIKTALEQIVIRQNGGVINNSNLPWAKENTLLEIKKLLENGIKVDGDNKPPHNKDDNPPKTGGGEDSKNNNPPKPPKKTNSKKQFKGKDDNPSKPPKKIEPEKQFKGIDQFIEDYYGYFADADKGLKEKNKLNDATKDFFKKNNFVSTKESIENFLKNLEEFNESIIDEDFDINKNFKNFISNILGNMEVIVATANVEPPRSAGNTVSDQSKVEAEDVTNQPEVEIDENLIRQRAKEIFDSQLNVKKNQINKKDTPIEVGKELVKLKDNFNKDFKNISLNSLLSSFGEDALKGGITDEVEKQALEWIKSYYGTRIEKDDKIIPLHSNTQEETLDKSELEQQNTLLDELNAKKERANEILIKQKIELQEIVELLQIYKDLSSRESNDALKSDVALLAQFAKLSSDIENKLSVGNITPKTLRDVAIDSYDINPVAEEIEKQIKQNKLLDEYNTKKQRANELLKEEALTQEQVKELLQIKWDLERQEMRSAIVATNDDNIISENFQLGMDMAGKLTPGIRIGDISVPIDNSLKGIGEYSDIDKASEYLYQYIQRQRELKEEKEAMASLEEDTTFPDNSSLIEQTRAEISGLESENVALEDKLVLLEKIADLSGISESAILKDLNNESSAIRQLLKDYDKIIVKYEDSEGKSHTTNLLRSKTGFEDFARIADGVPYLKSKKNAPITDIQFVRNVPKEETTTRQENAVDAKTEAQAIDDNKKLSITYDELIKKLEAYFELKNKVMGLMDRGEDASALSPDLRTAENDIAQYFDKNNPEPTRSQDGIKMMLQSYPMSIDKNSIVKSLCNTLGIEIPKAVEKGTAALEKQNRTLEENIAFLKEKAKTMTLDEWKAADRERGEIWDAKYAVYESGRHDVAHEGFWREANYGKQVNYSPMSFEDTKEVLYDKVGDNIWSGWFRSYDSDYKPIITDAILGDDELRNASMNMLWQRYQEFIGENIDFFEFLTKEIPAYRGKNEEKIIDNDTFMSFTFDENIAKKFGDTVIKQMIRPIDTLGGGIRNGEVEIMVPTDRVEAFKDIPRNTKIDYRNPDDENANKILAIANARQEENKVIEESKAAIEGVTEAKAVDVLTEAEKKELEVRKQLQNELIQKNNPKDPNINQYATWINKPEDIKTYREATEEDETIETGVTPDFTSKDVEIALQTGTITVYSSKPINLGSFVTPSKMEAQSYGNPNPYSKKVKLTDVAWIDGGQGQYAPISDEDIQARLNAISETPSVAGAQSTISDADISVLTQALTTALETGIGQIDSEKLNEINSLLISLAESLTRFQSVIKPEEFEIALNGLIQKINAIEVDTSKININGEINTEALSGALDGLVGYINRAAEKINNLEIDKINPEISVNDLISKNSFNIDSSKEITDLNNIENSIRKITDEVNRKTEAFKNEEIEVARIAQSEVDALVPLQNKLETITNLINNIKSGSDIGTGLSNININVTSNLDLGLDSSSILTQISTAVEEIVTAAKASIQPYNDITTVLGQTKTNIQVVADAIANIKVNSSETSRQTTATVDVQALAQALKNIKVNGQIDTKDLAKEKTLNGVIKTLLNSIKTNTNNSSKDLATNAQLKSMHNTIGNIAKAVESINGKIVKGTNIIEKGDATGKTAKKKKKIEHKDGSIKHGEAEGESGSEEKLLNYYYWIEEQIKQFKDNEKYVSALTEVQNNLIPKVAEFYDKLWSVDLTDPSQNAERYRWLLPLEEKHNLHMEKIAGGQEYSDSISDENMAIKLLKDEYAIRKQIFTLEQSGATEEQLKPLRESLAIYTKIREIIESTMSADDLDRYNSRAIMVQDKGDRQLTVSQIKAEIKEKKNSFKELLKLQKAYYDSELALAKEADGEKKKALEQNRNERKGEYGRAKQLTVLTPEQEAQLARNKKEYKRDMRVIKGANVDKVAVKDEKDANKVKADSIKELVKLYKQLGKIESDLENSKLDTEANQNLKQRRLTVLSKINDAKTAAQGVGAIVDDKALDVVRSTAKAERDEISSAAKARQKDAEAVAKEKEELKGKKKVLLEIEAIYKKIGKLKAERDFAYSQEAKQAKQDEIDALTKDAKKKVRDNNLTPDYKVLKQSEQDAYRTTANNKRASKGESDAKKADTEAAREQKSSVKVVEALYKKLGRAQSNLEYAEGNSVQQAAKQVIIDDLNRQIALKSEGLTLDEAHLENLRVEAKLQQDVVNNQQVANKISSENNKAEKNKFYELLKLQKKYYGAQEALEKASTSNKKNAIRKNRDELKAKYESKLKDITLNDEQQAKLNANTDNHNRNISVIRADNNDKAQKATDVEQKKKNEIQVNEIYQRRANIINEIIKGQKELNRQTTKEGKDAAQKILDAEMDKLRQINEEIDQSDLVFDDAKLSAQNDKLVNGLSGENKSKYIKEQEAAGKEKIAKEKETLDELIKLQKEYYDALKGMENASTEEEEAEILKRADRIQGELNQKKQEASLTQEQINILAAEEVKCKEKLNEATQKKIGQARQAQEKKNFQEQQKALTEIESLYKKIGTLRSRQAGRLTQDAIDEDEKEIQALRAKIASLIQSNKLQRQDSKWKGIEDDAFNSAERRRKANKDDRDFKAELRQSQRDARVDKASSVVKKAQDVFGNVAGIEGLTDEQVKKLEQYKNETASLKSLYDEIKAQKGPVTKDQAKRVETQTNNVNKLTKEISQMIKQYEDLSGDNVSVIGENKLKNSDEYRNKDLYFKQFETQLTDAVSTYTNGRAQITGFDADTKTLTYTLETGKNEITSYTAALRDLDGALVTVRGTTKKLPTLLESLKAKTKQIFSYFVGSSSIYKVINAVKQGIQYVKEIDLAMTELKKVTNETAETYDKFMKTAAKTASTVGSTMKDVISSTADWARLGSVLETLILGPLYSNI